jgi:NAD(P)-dependent dehydrogenase (short-subunit alcohol dehydrogenase family)
LTQLGLSICRVVRRNYYAITNTRRELTIQPEEIAPAFVYFASEADSSYVTGEVLTLLGGETTAS